MVVQGRYHQQNIRESTGCGIGPGGTQCTIIALAAIAVASLLITPPNWDSHTVDLALEGGDLAYCYVIDTYHHGNDVYLGHDQIPHNIPLFNNPHTVNMGITLFGVIGSTDNPVMSLTDLPLALQIVFSQSSYALATFGANTLALMLHENTYYLFDSHANDIHGNTDPYGAAVLLNFENANQLLDYIYTHYYGNQFDITSVDILHHRYQFKTMLTPLATVLHPKPLIAPNNHPLCLMNLLYLLLVLLHSSLPNQVKLLHNHQLLFLVLLILIPLLLHPCSLT